MKLLGVKVKIGATASNEEGVSAFVDGEGKITETVRAGLTITAELEGGILMRFRYADPPTVTTIKLNTLRIE